MKQGAPLSDKQLPILAAFYDHWDKNDSVTCLPAELTLPLYGPQRDCCMRLFTVQPESFTAQSFCFSSMTARVSVRIRLKRKHCQFPRLISALH